MSQIRDRLNSSSRIMSRSVEKGDTGITSAENILIIQSAHPDRVLLALKALAEKPIFADPRYTLFCRNEPAILDFFKNHPMLAGIRRHTGIQTVIKDLRGLRQEKYDGVVLLFTDEPGHWKIKCFAFLLGIRNKLIFNESNHCFYFTWGFTLSLIWQRVKNRFIASGIDWAGRVKTLLGLPFSFLHRRRHRKESESYPGERILVLQSAQPGSVLRALDRLNQAPLFANPRYTLFCRNFPEVVDQFRKHPMVYETRIHTRTRNSWGHLRGLRRERYDAVVLFLTGDPGYWKIKCFAFLLGARHKVIFNENNDCFYFQWKAWFRLLAHRMASRSRVSTHASWTSQAAGLFLYLVKFLLFPFRFLWLLMVWVQLRRSAKKASN